MFFLYFKKTNTPQFKEKLPIFVVFQKLTIHNMNLHEFIFLTFTCKKKIMFLTCKIEKNTHLILFFLFLSNDFTIFIFFKHAQKRIFSYKK